LKFILSKGLFWDFKNNLYVFGFVVMPLGGLVYQFIKEKSFKKIKKT